MSIGEQAESQAVLTVIETGAQMREYWGER